MFKNLPNTKSEFYSAIISECLNALRRNNHLDNFDTQRYKSDSGLRSKIYAISQRIFFIIWFHRHRSALFRSYTALSGDDSKRLYLILISYRLAGHRRIKIPADFISKSADYAAYQGLEQGSDSQLALTGMFGKLKHFDFQFEDHQYKIDCLGLEYYLFRRQYFYEKNGILIAPQTGDFVIDGGACTGDTALVFSNAVGPTGRVYAFDPVAEHLELMEHNRRQFPLPNVELMPYGLSNIDVNCAPIVVNKYSPGFRIDQQQVPLRRIDSLVKSGDITRVDFIKMDIEGAEMQALHGAHQTISRFQPKLGISLYHKPNDLFEIVLYIQQTYPFYQLYIDHYTIHQEETVLYCIAPQHSMQP
jgi:FkbM family methyltransferase